MNQKFTSDKILVETNYQFLKGIKLLLDRDTQLHSCYFSPSTIEDTIHYTNELKLIIVVDKRIMVRGHLLRKMFEKEILEFFYPNFKYFRIIIITINNIGIEEKKILCFNTLFWYGKEDLRKNIQCNFKDMNFKENTLTKFTRMLENDVYFSGPTLARERSGQGHQGGYKIIREKSLSLIIEYLYSKNIEKMNRISYSHKDMFMDISNNANIQKIDKLICSEMYNLVRCCCCCDTKNKEFFFFLKDYLKYCEGKKTIDEIRKNDYGNYNKLLKELK